MKSFFSSREPKIRQQEVVSQKIIYSGDCSRRANDTQDAKKLKIIRKRFADFLKKFFHKSISIDEVKTTSQCEKGPFQSLDQKETINLKKIYFAKK